MFPQIPNKILSNFHIDGNYQLILNVTNTKLSSILENYNDTLKRHNVKRRYIQDKIYIETPVSGMIKTDLKLYNSAILCMDKYSEECQIINVHLFQDQILKMDKQVVKLLIAWQGVTRLISFSFLIPMYATQVKRIPKKFYQNIISFSEDWSVHFIDTINIIKPSVVSDDNPVLIVKKQPTVQELKDNLNKLSFFSINNTRYHTPKYQVSNLLFSKYDKEFVNFPSKIFLKHISSFKFIFERSSLYNSLTQSFPYSKTIMFPYTKREKFNSITEKHLDSITGEIITRKISSSHISSFNYSENPLNTNSVIILNQLRGEFRFNKIILIDSLFVAVGSISKTKKVLNKSFKIKIEGFVDSFLVYSGEMKLVDIVSSPGGVVDLSRKVKPNHFARVNKLVFSYSLDRVDRNTNLPIEFRTMNYRLVLFGITYNLMEPTYKHIDVYTLNTEIKESNSFITNEDYDDHSSYLFDSVVYPKDGITKMGHLGSIIHINEDNSLSPQITMDNYLNGGAHINRFIELISQPVANNAVIYYGKIPIESPVISLDSLPQYRLTTVKRVCNYTILYTLDNI